MAGRGQGKVWAVAATAAAAATAAVVVVVVVVVVVYLVPPPPWRTREGEAGVRKTMARVLIVGGTGHAPHAR